MNRVISLISIIITVSVTSLFADECPQYIPQTPEAQAVARSIDFPVNLYTGIPGISIPIYEIKCGSLCVPISLDYQAGGIVPSQEATSVGLGWRINAGGAITRTIKCADDFHEGYANYKPQFLKGYFYEYSSNNTKDIHSCFSGSKLIVDSEPDIYYYSFPGNSGKFIFQRNKEVVRFDKSKPLSIRTDFGRPSFVITDSYGNDYYFEYWAKDTIYNYQFTGLLPNDAKSINTISEGYDYGAETDYYGDFNPLELSSIYTSCWNLTKITSPSHDTVYFDYKGVAYQLPLQESCNKKSLLLMGPAEYPAPDGTSGPREEVSYTRSKTVLFSQQLAGIRWRGGCVNFIEEEKSREDLKSFPHVSSSEPRAISKIVVLHESNTKEEKTDSVVRTYKLSYEYFNKEKGGKRSYLFKRLKLKSLVSDGINYSFTYNEEERLPVKNTKNTDYWGYYNGKDQGAEYYCSAIYQDREADMDLIKKHSDDTWYITDKQISLEQIRMLMNISVKLAY